MGMHIGLIAVKGELQRLTDAVAIVWPHLEPAAIAGPFAGEGDAWKWAEQHAKRVTAAQWSPANPGADAYLFYTSGPWAVMLDTSYVRSSDKAALAQLSELFGTSLAFVVESAGGTAFFACHENGAQKREIWYLDGEVHTEGEPLPEEKPRYRKSFYMDETEELMRAFGITFDEAALQAAQGIQYIDRRDYSHLQRHSPPAAKKPWWKFW